MAVTKKSAKKTGRTSPGLYANIKAKHDRIAHGSGERMRRPGENGAPSAEAFKESAESTRSNKTVRNASSKAARKASAKKATGKQASAKRPAR